MGSFVYFEDFEDHIKEAKKSMALDKLDKWLDDEIKRANDIIYKSKIKPYGEELHLLQTWIKDYKIVKDKIKKFYEEDRTD